MDKTKLAAFRESLILSGIDTSTWGLHGSKSVEHLYWEAFHQRGCLLAGTRVIGKLKRLTRIVKIRLVAEIFGVDHSLFSRMQFLHDGQCVEREQVPLRRLRWIGRQGEYEGDVDESFSAQDCPHTEGWRDGVREAVGALVDFIRNTVRSGDYWSAMDTFAESKKEKALGFWGKMWQTCSGEGEKQIIETTHAPVKSEQVLLGREQEAMSPAKAGK